MVVTDETVVPLIVHCTVLVLVEELLLQQCGRRKRHGSLQLCIILSSRQGRLYGQEVNLCPLNDLIAEVGRFTVSVEVGTVTILWHGLL